MVLILSGIAASFLLNFELLTYLRFIWIPWVLLSVMLLTAFHPIGAGSAVADEDESAEARLLWLGSWLYPLGFGAMIVFYDRIGGTQFVLGAIAFGWIGWGLLNAYLRRTTWLYPRYFLSESFDETDDEDWAADDDDENALEDEYGDEDTTLHREGGSNGSS
jgi:hypothetical protein